MSLLIRSIRTERDFWRALETEKRVVAVRFGAASDALCAHTDGLLGLLAAPLRRFYDILACETGDVPRLVSKYSLTDGLNLMFFYRGKPLHVNLGRKALDRLQVRVPGKEELLSLMVSVFQGASRGRREILFPVGYLDTGADSPRSSCRRAGSVFGSF